MAKQEITADNLDEARDARMQAILDRMGDPDAAPAAAADDAEFEDPAGEEPAAGAEAADDGPEPEDEEEAETPAPAASVAPPTAVAKPPAPAPDPAREVVLGQLQDALNRRKAELDSVAERYGKLEAKRELYEKFERAIEMMEESDPVAALQELGMDPKAVIQAVAEGRGVSPGAKARRAENERLTAVQKRLDDMEKLAQRREHEAEMGKQRDAAYAEIAELSAPDPVLSALGDTGRDSVVFWLHQEHAKTGTVHSYADGVKAAAEHWRELLHTVLENPKAREALLGSGDAGQTDTTPTETSPARRSKPKTATTTAPPPEETEEERFERIWGQHAEKARKPRRRSQ